MANVGAVVSLIGFAPAILALYYFLKRYDGFFDDRRLFKVFAVGMVIGMLVAVFHNTSDPFLLAYPDLTILFFVIAFPVFEELFKLIILNMKRFQGRFDTAFYGVAMGAGIGSTMVLANALIALPTAGEGEYWSAVGALAVLSVAQTFMLASTGAFIGIGSAKKDTWTGLIRASLVHIVFVFILLPYHWRLGYWAFIALGASLVFSLGVSYYAVTDAIAKSLPEEVRKELRRKERKDREKV